MPCYKCNNGKWKYGKRGRCQFDTLKACRAAEAAIHARKDIDECEDCDNPSWGVDYVDPVLDLDSIEEKTMAKAPESPMDWEKVKPSKK